MIEASLGCRPSQRSVVMGMVSIVTGLLVALVFLAGAVQFWASSAMRYGFLLLSVVAVVAGLAFSSIRYVGPTEVGIVKKNALGSKLGGGRIIATGGEMGIQADVLAPGWQAGFWPIVYDVSTVPLVEVPSDKVGLVEALDGDPLDPGQVFAPEVEPAEFKKFVEDPSHFLAQGGRKGPQSNVLTPGKYRVNTELFKVEMVDATNVANAEVAVLKSNFGADPTISRAIVDDEDPVTLADTGEKGVRAVPLPPGTYPINPRAFEVTNVSTRETILRFTAAQAEANRAVTVNANLIEQAAITVRTSDGFTFPVDVRVEYKIEPQNAPIVVAKLGSEQTPLLSKMNSAVRAIFRNNAESVKALDYVNQRSKQESQSLAMLQDAMEDLGVSVLAVRIGDVGNEETLGDLLATQRNREIALQEQETFREQQRAAEQKKALTKTEQEAEEERRLATAEYQVEIASREKEKAVIAAQAEAEAIQIRAQAQADAFRLIADQIGSGNAALIEVLKIVGENSIEITPRVMVSNTPGDTGSRTGRSQDSETTALIGTMLDTMVHRNDQSTRDERGGEQDSRSVSQTSESP
ncbi:MAG: SPFH domain-containing protein [Planctomycetota bacterium]